MSQIVVVFNAPGATQAQYDGVMDDLKAANADHQPARTYHFAGPSPDGWLVVDVWNSVEDLDTFFVTLGPLLAKNNFPEVQPMVTPIYNTVL